MDEEARCREVGRAKDRPGETPDERLASVEQLANGPVKLMVQVNGSIATRRSQQRGQGRFQL
jgi:hypothetical protein